MIRCGFIASIMGKLFRWTNIFIKEIFIFAFLVQKMDFEQPQFRRMGVTLTEYYLFKFASLRVLGESSFKAPKVMFNEYFNHQNVHLC